MTPTSILVMCDSLVDPAAGDGTHVAELLRDDDVGLDLPPDVRIDRVQGTAGRRRLRDGGIDLGAREISGLDERCGHDRPLASLGGQSHSCVTPTTCSPSPSANRISVAAGTSEQIRICGR